MKLFLADLGKDNTKYLRKDIDGGFLTDKYEIDKYKLEQYGDVVDNLMIGNYNEFGQYVIQDEIKAELIKCTKVIEDNYENILFVKSQNEVNVFSYLNFAVKIVDYKENGYKTAILELLEPIYKAKGFIENTQATILKKVVLPDNEIFKDEVYKAFNIVIDNKGGKIELKDDEFKNIIDRKIKLLYIKKHIDMKKDFEIFYKKNVEELNKTEEGKKVLQEYEKAEKIVKDVAGLKPEDYETKTELLVNSVKQIMNRGLENGQNKTIGNKNESAPIIKKQVLPFEKIMSNVKDLYYKKANLIQEKLVEIEKKETKKDTKQLNNIMGQIKKQVDKKGNNFLEIREETLEIR